MALLSKKKKKNERKRKKDRRERDHRYGKKLEIKLPK